MDLAFCWGPAVPTEVWSSQLKTDKEEDEGGEGRKEERKEGRKEGETRLGITVYKWVNLGVCECQPQWFIKMVPPPPRPNTPGVTFFCIKPGSKKLATSRLEDDLCKVFLVNRG